MKSFTEIALRLWNRIARAQSRVQRLLVKKANQIGVCLLTVDMMVIVRENEKIAIANILPKGRPQIGQFVDFAFLYLDLPAARIPAGFYKLQLSNDRLAIQAQLLDIDNQLIGNVRYFDIDIFASIVGSKDVPAKKLPIFETINKTNDTYVIGGVHADGQAFAIALDF